MTILLASLTSASGFGGAFVGPVGSGAPASSATQLVVARAATGNTVILTAQVSSSLSDLALVLPVPGIDPASILEILPSQLEIAELFTEPRVERLTCDELVDIYHWESPPGCASFDPDRAVSLVGEDAVDAVSALPSPFASVTLEIEVVPAAEFQAWLDQRAFGMDPAYAAALQPHLDAGAPLLTIHPTFPLELGQWLPPVRFILAPGDWALPLSAGAAAAVGRHELIVYTLGGPEQGNPAFSNYPKGTVQTDCVLADGQDGSEWLAAERAAIDEETTVPAWVLEYSGLADRCSPCTSEPLDAFTVSVLGASGEPSETRIGRLWFAWEPGELLDDPVLTFADPAVDAELRFLLNEEGLDGIYQACGATAVDPNAPVCDNITLPGSGCDSASRAASLAACALAALVLARRRPAALAALLVLALSTTARAGPADPSPRIEVSGAVSLIGTDRIVPTGLERGAPWLGNPYVGAEVRGTLFAWRDGRTLGLIGGLRGLAGKAAPWGDQGVLSFVLLEPTVAVDVRHGRFREASPCFFGRYGADVALPIVDPSVSPPQARMVGGLHAGFGTWFGRGTQRTSVELRGSVFLRTDGFETTYDPNLGWPGYMFLPGTANLWVLAGRSFY